VRTEGRAHHLDEVPGKDRVCKLQLYCGNSWQTLAKSKQTYYRLWSSRL